MLLRGFTWNAVFGAFSYLHMRTTEASELPSLLLHSATWKEVVSADVVHCVQSDIGLIEAVVTFSGQKCKWHIYCFDGLSQRTTNVGQVGGPTFSQLYSG